MIESGFWIFLVEAAVAAALFIGLIIWVMRGPSESQKRRYENARKVQHQGEIKTIRPEDGERS
jgi:hypothetical protein